MERLDRFYVNDSTIGRGGQLGVVHGTTLLDHARVTLTLDSIARSLAPRSCRSLDSIYIREEVQNRLIGDREWDACGDMVEQVAQALIETSHICQEAAYRFGRSGG